MTTLFLTELKPRMVLMCGTGARTNQQLRTGDVNVPPDTPGFPQPAAGFRLQKTSTKIFVDSYEGLRIWFLHED
jgi:hypothetical protein